MLGAQDIMDDAVDNENVVLASLILPASHLAVRHVGVNDRIFIIVDHSH